MILQALSSQTFPKYDLYLCEWLVLWRTLVYSSFESLGGIVGLYLKQRTHPLIARIKAEFHRKESNPLSQPFMSELEIAV